jgi:hypothetical protein
MKGLATLLLLHGAVAPLLLGCNALMDLGRFNEAVAHDGGGAASDTSVGLPDKLACLALPNETLDPGPVSLQILLANATQQTESPGTIDGGTDITDAVYTPFPGITMRACLALDPGCASPVTSPVVSDDAGAVNFTLPGTFNGFFRGEAPSVVSFTFFPGQWLTGAKSAQYATGALANTDEVLLNGALNNAVNLDAGSGLGEVFVSIRDCNDHRLAGVTLALSRTGPDTLPFYIISGVPSTTTQVTDNGGVGGAVNVPEGSVKITATHLATSTTVGTADVYIRPGELTYAWIRPRVH